MEAFQINKDENPIQKPGKSFMIAQILLRIMVAATALAATLIMATNKQSASLFGLQILSKYSYAPAFRFFVIANAIAAGYSVLSLPFVFLLNSPTSDRRSSFLMFLFDSIITGLAIAGSSAATAIAYVGKYGNSHAGWAAICNNFGRFCDRASAALICSYTSFILLFLLSVLSASKPRQTT